MLLGGSVRFRSEGRLIRDAERELLNKPRSPTSGSCKSAGWRSGEKSGRERDTGARINEALEGQSCAADSKLLTSALRYVSHSRPKTA